MKARLEFLHQGKLARVVLAAPKANILDKTMVDELDAIFAQLQSNRELRAIVVTADGPHFSFGASVEEHLPDQIGSALSRLGSLLRRVAAAPAPVIAAVRGQCLGGGFELVLVCDLIIAEETAQFGIPEIKLGVFPPAASVLLPLRIGTAGASALTLTGRSWTAVEAKQQGLVTRLSSEGQLEATLASWLEEDFLPRSPAALRYATRVIRMPLVHALNDQLPELDRLYLDELMAEPDAVEGIRAFLEKRQPKWITPGEAQ